MIAGLLPSRGPSPLLGRSYYLRAGPGRLRFFLGGAGQSPQTVIVAPPPYRDPSPARRYGGRPAASFGGESLCPFFMKKRLTIVISMNLVTPAVPCLRQVVHALADPASRDRP